MAERRTARVQRDRRAAAAENPAYDEDAAEPEPSDLYQDEDDRADGEPAGGQGDPAPHRHRQHAGNAASSMSASDVAEAALRNLASLIGKKPEGITAVEPSDDGWLVGVEVIEDQRIPSSSDILAIYEAELAEDGSLVSYRRTRRYARGRGDMSEGR